MSELNILSAGDYFNIVNFVCNFKDLPIDCELQLREEFKQTDQRTLTSILFALCLEKTKVDYWAYSARSGKLLQRFESSNPRHFKFRTMLELARESGIPPTVISRILVCEKYRDLPKHSISNALRVPKLIPNKNLAQSVIASVFIDNQEGPIVDIIKRCSGEEYEVKLKEMATQAGMTFSDEGDLRKTGFDKTPDIKLNLPCLYKGEVVNWIESKALFGDIKTHKRYIRQQFASYNNRFGPGIVIYWFGFLEDIVLLKESGDNIIVTNHFPEKKFLEFFEY